MKTLVSSCIFLVIGFVVNAQAKISFDQTTVSYSNVEQGKESTRTFSFKNTGDQPLIIKKVTTTSSHLKVSTPQNNIAPGKSGKIKVVFDAQQKGPIRRTITVFSNAENAPYKALKVTGNVIKNKE